MCGQVKPSSEFFSHSQTKTGLRLHRCKVCDTIYHRDRARQKKKDLVDYKGGKCEVCGYDKCLDALEFHHLSDKDFGIGSNTKLSYARLVKEVEKCILLCSNCHKERHYDERRYCGVSQ